MFNNHILVSGSSHGL